ncbi:nuclease-related domain-containing protein [Psychrobacillus glaciei]|uniref:nuclease-related domain-containing protein n=1 Tax=Psychrobacillus glaciei TaxID=2283160 RepID=UPI001CEFB0D0|nr:nuclease-related domain-containing protein [Psychrobacillus glaciei]
MIPIISRNFPKSYIDLSRLLLRLEPSHSSKKEVEKKFHQIEAGYFGEKLVDNTLLEINFPSHYCILPDVHLKVHDHLYIQMDTLIVTKKYLLVIEVKNIVGTITFHKHSGQTIRTLDGVKTPFECPISQINRHVQSLEQMRFPLPIFKAIVYSSNRVILENVPMDEPIFFRKNLSSYIHHLNKKEDRIDTSQFHDLIRKIQSMQHIIQRKPLCDRWRVSPESLIKGLLCNVCGNILYKISNKTWKCTKCESNDRTPIMHNINDYFILVKDSITTTECKEFFHLSSTHEAYYMLKKCNLINVNNARKSVYRRNMKVL